MGWRNTGEKKIKEEEVSERFCDICKKTIQEGFYPELQLRIAWREYEFEGDAPEYLDVCSPECLITKAQELISHRTVGEEKKGR